MSVSFRKRLGTRLPRLAFFAGDTSSVLTVGGPFGSGEGFVRICCGDEVRQNRTYRSPWFSAERSCRRVASAGGVAIIAPHLPSVMGRGILSGAIEVPELLGLSRSLPNTLEELHQSLRTSTTREDLRRIRKADFRYTITKDEEAAHEFYSQYARALVKKQFPRDGGIDGIDFFLNKLKNHGELICVMSENDWLAGIFNEISGDTYALWQIGIHQGSEDIRNKHVTSALLIRSFERGVELGLKKVSLGLSIPFLGKGPIWFKAKWGGTLELNKSQPILRILMDLRHASIREILHRNPIVHRWQEKLAVSCWLKPGPRNLQSMLRNYDMFHGIDRWYVLGDTKTISEGASLLAEKEAIVPVAVPSDMSKPLWLGNILKGHLS